MFHSIKEEEVHEKAEYQRRISKEENKLFKKTFKIFKMLSDLNIKQLCRITEIGRQLPENMNIEKRKT
jgi:hypothetical protein